MRQILFPYTFFRGSPVAYDKIPEGIRGYFVNAWM